MIEFLRKNVIYPADAEENGKTGRVIVSFIIDVDGSVTNAKVVKSVYPSIDAEALRVVNAMPKWTPGKLASKPVRVKYNIPITFNL